MRVVLGAALAIGLFTLGCGNRGDDDGGDVESIEIEPASATITMPLGGQATQDYKVYGITQSNTRKDITASCTIAIDTSFGSVSGATVTVSGRGGKTDVIAACNDLSATGVLIINLQGDVIAPGAPANAAELFENATATTDAARTPGIEYPFDKAVSPRNIPSVEMQYTTAGNDLFHVTMSSQFATINIYTTAAEAMLSQGEWSALANTAAGENLSFAVEGLAQASPSTKYAATPVIITMSTDTIDQSAIYWWASSEGSVMSQTFGEADNPDLVKDNCTSCHSVSRQGTRIGYSRCVAGSCASSQLAIGFMKYDPMTDTWVDTMNADGLAVLGSYSTFAPVGNPFPTDEQSVAIVSKFGGTLGLYDPDTGAAVPSNIDIANEAGRGALMADWSADGNSVVYTQANAGAYIDLNTGRIATMSYSYAGQVHTFGSPVVITPNPITLANGTYDNFFFPSFSADGALIVFNASRGGWRGNPSRYTGSRLMLTTPDGSWIEDLTAMNGGMADLGITWPHWAPTVSNDYYWVVFSSERDYGHRATMATSPAACTSNGIALQCKQIWLGAIAKNRLGGGMDPSAPPMWMPGQSPTANNISPYWSRPAVIQ
ncbi:MAG: TolB family protein [Kofleriaceae bacterium]